MMVALLSLCHSWWPRPKEEECVVYFGTVAKVTYNRVSKEVPGSRAHLTERSGEAVCKWFYEKLTSNEKASATHYGRKSFEIEQPHHLGGHNSTQAPQKMQGGGRRTYMTNDNQNMCQTWSSHLTALCKIEHEHVRT